LYFKQAIQSYKEHLINLERSEKTIKGYVQDLDFFRKDVERKFNGPIPLSALSPKEANRFLLWLKVERGYKPSSRRRIAATLKGFFQFCHEEKWVGEELAKSVPNIRVPDKERAYLTPDKVGEWVDAVDSPLIKVIMWTLYYAGLRISEAVNLEVGDVNLPKEGVEKGGTLHIRNSKGGKHRLMPMAPALVPILRDYSAWRVPSLHFFATRKTAWIRTQTIQTAMREAREGLNWPNNITPHSLRHSFASKVYQDTGDILVTSTLLGHKKLSTTQIYAHVHRDQLENAVQVFE